MKQLNGPPAWTFVFVCSGCGSKHEAGIDDVEKDRFKERGDMWYGGDTGTLKYFVSCPLCREITFVPEKKLNTYVRQQAKG